MIGGDSSRNYGREAAVGRKSSEAAKPLPRLRFGLVGDVSIPAAHSISPPPTKIAQSVGFYGSRGPIREAQGAPMRRGGGPGQAGNSSVGQ